MWFAYALLNRIRLSTSPAVLAEAEAVLKRIAEQYFSPNLSLEGFRTIVLSYDGDPLEAIHAARLHETGVLPMNTKLERSHLIMRNGPQNQIPG